MLDLETEETIEIEIGEIIYWEYELDEFIQAEVIGVDLLNNLVNISFAINPDSKIKTTRWVASDDIYKEEDLVFVEV
ncbi:MAG: hypothetical protein EAZ77_09905 [Nostocales cyanobacterium]|nr:MAG: hypothetical protein EAZ77_09905 [Nostocales cyanobacterium]